MAWHEGDVCHKLRRVCGWTVQELAKKATLNPAVIYRLEDGRTKEPKRATLAKLAQAFGLTPREFNDTVPPWSTGLTRDQMNGFVNLEATFSDLAGRAVIETQMANVFYR